MATPIELGNVPSGLLPNDVTGPIFAKAVESSAVMSLARSIPLAIDATTAIPVPGDVPVAGWITEGQRKPVSSGTLGIKTMSGHKVAVLVPVSEEVALTDPASLYTQLTNDLPTAIGRAFDRAAIHGTGMDGSPGPFGDYLAMTTNTVALGTASQATGGIYADIVNGEALVDNNEYDFSGFAADPRLRTQLKLATDTQGHPIFVPDLNAGSGAGGNGTSTLDGFSVSFNRGVGGALRRQASTLSRVVVGTLTSGSPTITGVAGDFGVADKGSVVSGTGITTGTTITAVATDGSTATMSANAIATESPAEPITVTASALTNLRAIGGDWSQCAYGVGRSITVKVSNEASYVDGDGTTHSAFQENLVLLLVEAYYGFIVADPNAFVIYHA